MQAPLLSATDAPLCVDPGSVEAHVGACMRSIACKRQDPVLILESLAGALQVASTSAPEPAARSVRAAHLAVRALSAVRPPPPVPTMHARVSTASSNPSPAATPRPLPQTRICDATFPSHRRPVRLKAGGSQTPPSFPARLRWPACCSSFLDGMEMLTSRCPHARVAWRSSAVSSGWRVGCGAAARRARWRRPGGHAADVAGAAVQEGGEQVEYVPTVLLSELARLSTLPSPAPQEASAHLVLQTVAARAAADAAALSPEPLKAVPLTQLQDSLATQLDVKLPHSPAQLAAASRLFAATAVHTPAPSLARSSAVVLSNARSAAAAPQAAQTAVEVLRTCDHCAHHLCVRAGVELPQPTPLPASACTTLRVDPATDALVATGAHPKPDESEKAISVLQQSGAVQTYALRASRCPGPVLTCP